MASTLPKLHFGAFPVASQVFHTTPLSFALVNLKPLAPGHVLVCPRRVTPRLAQLSRAEVADLFVTVQRVARTIERVYGARALNVAVQDGEHAGQSVPHVHVHVIPRGGSGEKIEGDEVYKMLEGEEGDVGAVLREREEERRRFARSDAERKGRGMEEMEEEARRLRGEMEKDEREE